LYRQVVNYDSFCQQVRIARVGKLGVMVYRELNTTL
jgi:hypothetical protein